MYWFRWSLVPGFRLSQYGLENSSSWNCRSGGQPQTTVNPPKGGWSEQPTAMPKWRLICFSEHFTYCSLVHSLGSRTREFFFSTERSFEVPWARPFHCEAESVTFQWNLTNPWTWQLTPFKRLGSLFRKILQPGGVSFLCDILVWRVVLGTGFRCYVRTRIHQTSTSKPLS